MEIKKDAVRHKATTTTSNDNNIINVISTIAVVWLFGLVVTRWPRST